MNFLAALLFIIGLGVALAFAVRLPPPLRPIMAGLYVWHTALCLVYFWVASGSFDPDSIKYYLAASSHLPFGIGTDSVYWFVGAVQDFIHLFGGDFTYLDFFLLFNLFGYAGLALLFWTLIEAASLRSRRLFIYVLVAVLLPGLSFWTSALGKDSVVFLGVALMLFAMSNLRRRYVWMAVAMALLFLVRPYILIVPAAAFGALVLLNRRIPIIWRIGGLVMLAGLGALIAPAIMKYVSLNSLSADDISAYVSTRQGYNIEGAGGVDISSYNIIEKIFSYLFMPLFIGAANILGIFASLENLLLLLLVGGAFWIGRAEWRRVIGQPVGLFHLTFAAVGVLMESDVTANLGIAVRQKVMFIPGLLVVCVLLLRSAWESRAAAQSAAQRVNTAHAARLAAYRGAAPAVVADGGQP